MRLVKFMYVCGAVVLACLIPVKQANAVSLENKIQNLVAQAPPQVTRLSPLPQSLEIMAVTDATTLVDKKGGVFALSHINVPESQNLAAMDHLRALTHDKMLRGFQSRDEKTGRINRKGQSLVHLVRRTDNVWVQGSLVRNGFAYVDPIPPSPILDDLMKWENEARQNKRGLWVDKNAILSPTTAQTALYRFAVIEGRVEKVALQRNGIYLNFGKNWKDDFTVFIPSALRSQFAREAIQLTSLGGVSIRVRGVVEKNNGSMITLASPRQLEILDRIKRTNIPTPQKPTQTKP